MWFSRHTHSYEEYLHFEHDASSKHEYINGDIIAMAGGSPSHAAIAVNVGAALISQLRDMPCRVFSSDLKVRIAAVNVATYPDLSVVCGDVELDPTDDKGHTILNPIVLVEVLSPSTAMYDCNEKLEFYKRIPSLQEVVHVDYARRRVGIWRKWFGGSGWYMEELTSGEGKLDSIGCVLTIDDVYRNESPAS
jgi:Uma2 family endonuclease